MALWLLAAVFFHVLSCSLRLLNVVFPFCTVIIALVNMELVPLLFSLVCGMFTVSLDLFALPLGASYILFIRHIQPVWMQSNLHILTVLATSALVDNTLYGP